MNYYNEISEIQQKIINQINKSYPIAEIIINIKLYIKIFERETGLYPKVLKINERLFLQLKSIINFHNYTTGESLEPDYIWKNVKLVLYKQYDDIFKFSVEL